MTKFHGDVTVDNIEEIREMILEMLEDKTYTFVSVNDCFDFPHMTSVRTNQQMDDHRTSVYYGENREYAGFNIADSYGVWGLSTSVRHNQDRSGEFNNPYIVIDWTTIKITYRLDLGHLVHLQIKLQEG